MAATRPWASKHSTGPWTEVWKADWNGVNRTLDWKLEVRRVDSNKVCDCYLDQWLQIPYPVSNVRRTWSDVKDNRAIPRPNPEGFGSPAHLGPHNGGNIRANIDWLLKRPRRNVPYIDDLFTTYIPVSRNIVVQGNPHLLSIDIVRPVIYILRARCPAEETENEFSLQNRAWCDASVGSWSQNGELELCLRRWFGGNINHK